MNVKREAEKKHMVHWQACPNYKKLYGDGGELNLVSYYLKYLIVQAKAKKKIGPKNPSFPSGTNYL